MDKRRRKPSVAFELDRDLLARLDRQAKRCRVTRSVYIRALVRHALENGWTVARDEVVHTA